MGSPWWGVMKSELFWDQIHASIQRFRLCPYEGKNGNLQNSYQVDWLGGMSGCRFQMIRGRADLLQVSGNQITNSNETIYLRGVCVGGWMNMEEFINGYPGSEHGTRMRIAEVLGERKAEYFFDKMLDHFFAEDDVIYLKSLGATVVRLPLNYRHFEDDSIPFQYLEKGFTRLNQALEWCTRVLSY
jgi:hypothetical protein